MRTKLLVSLLVVFLLLTAYGQNDAVTESAWTQALRDVEALTGIHLVLDTDLPAEFTTQRRTQLWRSCARTEKRTK